MKILVRLPNWLGDMVMAVAALEALAAAYPGAEISVIAKHGLHDLLPYMPFNGSPFVFNRNEWKGIRGLWRFGRSLRNANRFDLFISLPDSFSSALIGYASGSRKRIGYSKEMRDVLLTQSLQKPKGLHRVEEYHTLISKAAASLLPPPSVKLQHSFPKNNTIVVNINSEASSRRLTIGKAVEILDALAVRTRLPIILIGGRGEQAFVEEVVSKLRNKNHVSSVAGKTSLPQLVEILAGARAMLSTDSGPAHLANALGTNTVVLFGAGNENNTAPWNTDHRVVIRLGKLTCEPCVRNVCVQFGTPQCLELLETPSIINTVIQQVSNG